MEIEEIQATVAPILHRYGVSYAGVFGSVARGAATEKSDLDLLITLEKPIGVFALARLRRELEEATGVSVDLVTTSALNARVSPYVYAEIKPLVL